MFTKHIAAPATAIHDNGLVCVAAIKHKTAKASDIMQMEMISSILFSDTNNPAQKKRGSQSRALIFYSIRFYEAR
ncbi:hypothetical protein [Tateyamaria omphalii]|uniref:hypothetical protein n=1 Tax=Tateyamaria omphalii TaxID=299262 RepID=UPI00167844EE|nr:hypothetical protein [Tateyamaria omphalii]